MPDLSALDSKYFIDSRTYNCPFCNRNHVPYTVKDQDFFDWNDKKRCHFFIVQCDSCDKRSMHLTFSGQIYWQGTAVGLTGAADLDAEFFYSVPTSFFTLDSRIPGVLRELMTEAEGCLKSNFLTGASACARKLIYELADLERAEGGNYDEKIKSLKAKRPEIDAAYFDTLLHIQKATSDKVHEGSYDGWESKHLRLILATLREILTEMYVVPKIREEKRLEVERLRKEVLEPRKVDMADIKRKQTEADKESSIE